MDKQFHLKIISPGSTLYDGATDSLVVKTIDGFIGILPGHMPLASVLANGSVQITNNQGTQAVEISGGILEVTSKEGTEVTILTN